MKTGVNMEVTAALREQLRNNPHDIKNYPDAPTELQMMCVKEDPWALYYMANAHPDVILEAYRTQSLLIRENDNPTEEQQLAAVSHDAHICDDIKNPCRAAVLVTLKQYGKFFAGLFQKQQLLGDQFAASSTTLQNDTELQAAALSNITGLTLFHEQPELFNRQGLGQQYPCLLKAVDQWSAIGYDYTDCEIIRENLRLAKTQDRPSYPNIRMPDSMEP